MRAKERDEGDQAGLAYLTMKYTYTQKQHRNILCGLRVSEEFRRYYIRVASMYLFMISFMFLSMTKITKGDSLPSFGSNTLSL
jgi:hypothetical protein